ncbi:MAG: hypothetical protein LC659_14600, partial [Myxococcales bacterium]|nr:hypothetical protein [Myxococcales bacterium]
VRGAGKLQGEQGGDGSVLALRSCPRAVLTDDTLPFALAAAFETFYTLTGHKGNVQFEARGDAFAFVFASPRR